MNSDAEIYGGSAEGNEGGVEALPAPLHGRPFSLTLTLPPLGAIFLQQREPPMSPTSPMPPEQESQEPREPQEPDTEG